MSIVSQFKKIPSAKTGVEPLKQPVLDLKLIRVNGGTQSRVALNDDVVDEYAAAVEAGLTFPPVIVFYDGADHWLADGFHRFWAHMKAGRKSIAVDARQGTRRDAILYSVGANGTHGLRPTNADKRCAVLTLLNDAEWGSKPERWIASAANVSHTFVQKLRAAHLATLPDRPADREVERSGVTYTMNTSAIGKKAVEADVSSAAAPPATKTLIPEVEALIAGTALDTEEWRASKISLTPSEQFTAAKRDLAYEKAKLKAAQNDANDAERERVRTALPQSIKDLEQAKAEWRAKAEAGRHDQEAVDRIAELEEAIRILEIENAALTAEVAKFGGMRVQFEQGGFDKVIADKDEQIRVLNSRVVSESANMAAWMKSAKYWQAEAKHLGWSNTVEIDIETGEVTDD